MVNKSAVLIGCNYPGTKVELKGCVNDVHRMRRSLIDRFGYSESNITTLIDTDDSYTLPTGVNIRRAINRIIRSADPGDELFVHYSGHGARLPAEPEEEHDNTGFHECIVPSDMNLIMDEDFGEFVGKLPEGSRLTIVADSCNSGGLIQNAKEQIGDSTIGRKSQVFTDVPTKVELHNNAKNEENELRGRALPLPTLIQILKQKTGVSNIHKANIRSKVSEIFKRDQINNDKEENRGAKKQGLLSQSGRAVLISACQSDENAADATPVARRAEAYGALSNVIQSILAGGEVKGEVLSNRKLVLMAREMLDKQGFVQRPGLYCTDDVAEEAFLVCGNVVGED